jgi:UDP-GlcNAc:undecaprenyl-phosphate GlcNAc-1-phosphate transferase
MMRFVFVVLGSFIISVGATALILKLSHSMGWYDRTGARKIHTGNIPRLGGLGFAVSFLIAFVAVTGPGLRFLPVVLAFLLVLLSGVRDDFKPLAPRYRLLAQAGAALCVLASGCLFERALFIDRPDVLGFPGWRLLRYPVSFLWIVGMTNAVNFIDGVDGLAGGVSLLAALSFGGIFLSLGGSGPVPLLCAALAAAIAGFLVFNAPFPRAKIFMGDGGAYVLGFSLALFPLMGRTNAPNMGTLPLFHAAAILLIPILDTTAAVWRRRRDGMRIDSPDRSHTHHKLMNLGLSARRIDAVLFALQIVLSVVVYIALTIRGYGSLLVLLLAYALGIGFFTVIHVLNRRRLTVSTDTSTGINHHLHTMWKTEAARFPGAS